MGNGASGQTILALVEKRTGLLAGKRHDQETNACLQNLKLVRRLTVKRASDQFQSFVLAHAHIVSFDYRARCKFLRQQLHQQQLDRLRSLRESL